MQRRMVFTNNNIIDTINTEKFYITHVIFMIIIKISLNYVGYLTRKNNSNTSNTNSNQSLTPHSIHIV